MAVVPIVIQLLPLLPTLVNLTLQLTEALKSDPTTPPEAKAKLLELSVRLKATMDAVEAVVLPD